MARMWGIGAYWSGDNPPDKTQSFIDEQCAQIGWSSNDAPALYEQFAQIEAGDIIYIKSKPPGKKLHIKAIGYVLDKPDGSKVKVKWMPNTSFEHDISAIESRYNVYSLTLYEEMNATCNRARIIRKMRATKPLRKETKSLVAQEFVRNAQKSCRFEIN